MFFFLQSGGGGGGGSTGGVRFEHIQRGVFALWFVGWTAWVGWSSMFAGVHNSVCVVRCGQDTGVVCGFFFALSIFCVGACVFCAYACVWLMFIARMFGDLTLFGRCVPVARFVLYILYKLYVLYTHHKRTGCGRQSQHSLCCAAAMAAYATLPCGKSA